ncbi:glycerol-3-phosphate 1-O-acyltransferase PlsY [Hazenella coriacea]|uniref:Glycerol-3-phosphate acyltransferase n=1 Tax=Hazenella coriacea TaxID=1179467 RepID=A0A4R3L1G7_9BACL|nr:glycerol-3-phosphate 1-O-acyltransferase PlsY [Hazenella coriacea]TCS93411.1 glycerol-3-phosphate acyltransferase PlsY [Hazenella coriacea]
MLLTWVLPTILSYFIGSISFSYLVARYLKGIDIRSHGSGNAGATNTLRVLGKVPGIAVFFLDVFKGMGAVGIGALFNSSEVGLVVCGIAAIVGHNWPIFLRFRGGKGVATTVGVTALLFFYAALISGILAILFIILTRYVSLGSLIYTISIPVILLLMNQSSSIIWLTTVIAVLAIYQHRQNITNLVKGQERKISSRE